MKYSIQGSFFPTSLNNYQYTGLQELKGKGTKMLQKDQNQIFQHPQVSQSCSQAVKEVYLCSCGKNYRSFAAVYLHVRIKHGIKLSTTSLEHRKRTLIQNHIRKIYYEVTDEHSDKNIPPKSRQLLRSRAKNNPPNHLQNENELFAGEWMKKIQQCFDKYLQQSSNKPRHIFQKLKIFLAREFENTHKRIPIKKIPQHLNNFAQKFLPTGEDPIKRETKNWYETCQELFYFSKWLRQQRYTEYFVFFQYGPLNN